MIVEQETLERFWDKVLFTTDCWEWQNCKDGGGYGMFSVNDKLIKVHRFSYEIHKGKIPNGMQIDHLCRVRHCVNPEHLEVVTQKENVLRGVGHTAINARKTHCLRGHLLPKEKDLWGSRNCLECDRLNTREAYKNNPEKNKACVKRWTRNHPNYQKEYQLKRKKMRDESKHE